MLEVWAAVELPAVTYFTTLFASTVEVGETNRFPEPPLEVEVTYPASFVKNETLEGSVIVNAVFPDEVTFHVPDFVEVPIVMVDVESPVKLVPDCPLIEIEEM